MLIDMFHPVGGLESRAKISLIQSSSDVFGKHCGKVASMAH